MAADQDDVLPKTPARTPAPTDAAGGPPNNFTSHSSTGEARHSARAFDDSPPATHAQPGVEYDADRVCWLPDLDIDVSPSGIAAPAASPPSSFEPLPFAMVDLVVADPGCASHDVVAYKRVWPTPRPSSGTGGLGAAEGATAPATPADVRNGSFESRVLDDLEKIKRAVSAECRPRNTKKSSSRSRSTKPRRKKITLKEAEAKLQAKENEILVRLRQERRTESEIDRTLKDDLYSLSAADLTTECGCAPSVAKTFSRTARYKRWKPHRKRGNAARLDPDSPAVSHTSRGGSLTKSRRTRNDGFTAANGLRVGRPAKLETLDPQAKREIEADPESADWWSKNAEKLEDPSDSEEAMDNR